MNYYFFNYKNKINFFISIKKMANTKIKSLNNIWKYFYTISLLLFSIINITSSERIESKDINNEDDFNNILKFNQKQYQINNFAKNENEDFIIQFS